VVQVVVEVPVVLANLELYTVLAGVCHMHQGQVVLEALERCGLETAEHMQAVVVVLELQGVQDLPEGPEDLVVVPLVKLQVLVQRLLEAPLEMRQATLVVGVVEQAHLDMAGTVVLGLLSLSQPKTVSVEHKQLLTPVVEHLQPNLVLL
jgi:hypothetical protein